MSEPNAGVPDSVQAAWRGAVDAWDDPARHEAVIVAVAQHSCYAWAAARYRERAGDPIADRQLDRLRRTATATLMASATVRPEAKKTPYQATIAILAVLVVAIVVGLLYVTVFRKDPAAPTSTPATQPATP